MPTKSDLSKKYKKYGQVEHVLKRPDTYVGSCAPEDSEEWVAYQKMDDPSQFKFEKKMVNIIPGLYKCFDELRVNALDQWRRTYDNPKVPKEHRVTKIEMIVNPDENILSVKNNGQGIDIEFMEEHQMYPAELIFGSLLTGTNFDDSEKRIVGGKNGYGAKLANIFATEFRVETVDAIRKRKISLVYRNNMSEHDSPKITDYKGKPYTIVSMKPDLKRFGCSRISNDMVALCLRATLDASAWTDSKTSLYWNGTKLPTKTLEDYANLWMGPEKDVPRVSLKFHPLWKAVISASNDDEMQQMSWVNGVATTRGGKHVETILDMICSELGKLIQKKNKYAVSKQTIRNQISILLQANVINPSFDSQTKEYLKTTKSKFGMELETPKRLAEQLASKTDIVKRVVAMHAFKNAKNLKKTDGSKKSTIRVPKLDDANHAGTKKSRNCTLILTEGDSAKAMAISGLSVVGRDTYGVFPLKGKPLNVKQEIKKIATNTEIINLKKILGLVQGMDYTPFIKDKTKEWPLRYGRVMIMADQDNDGFHIKGLVMNIFHTLWPSLLEHNFICSMVTPIVKVFPKGKKAKTSDTKQFYSLRKYEQWCQAEEQKKYDIKYYKGLGTSNSKEAKEYFRELRVIQYEPESQTKPVSPTETRIDPFKLAFDVNPDARKVWILNHKKPVEMDYENKQCSFQTYVDRELVQFSIADLKRSIPHMMDGLKPSQRKILFSSLKRNLVKEIKVSQLAGFVSENSAYHHGEDSLHKTIIKMAQTFVGSNNIPLLVPAGQFGTRLMGGKDYASPRYIFTKLQPYTTQFFQETDNQILKQLEDDGMKIEPEWYAPPIPMILVNGADGIGTGWSTTIPSHNPKDVIQCVKQAIKGDELSPIKPWYKGFHGEIEQISDTKFETRGVVEFGKKKNTLEIRELPIGSWTDNYKEWLENKASDSKKSGIKKVTNHSTDTVVHFTITIAPEAGSKCKLLQAFKSKDIKTLLVQLKLTSSLSYSNMHAFGIDHAIHKYSHPHELIHQFVRVRQIVYKKRRQKIIFDLNKICRELSEKMRFIMLVVEQSIELRNVSKKMIEDQLRKHSFKEPFDNFLRMPLYSITKEKVEELKKETDKHSKELKRMTKLTPADLWKLDLDVIEKSF